MTTNLLSVIEQQHKALEDAIHWRTTGNGRPPEQTCMDALAAGQQALEQTQVEADPDDSLLICASDLEHSAIYDNHSEMQSCIRAVAQRIKSLATHPQATEPAPKRPPNCGTGHCSCIECVMEPAPSTMPIGGWKVRVRGSNQELHCTGVYDDTIFVDFPAPSTAGEREALPMDTAPTDGTMIRLLVDFEGNSLEDTDQPVWTIGACYASDSEGDVWQFAGWNWSHDRFTEGHGKPIGWLPMLDAALLSAPALPAAAMPVGELTDQSNLATIAGLESATGHLSAMVDELRVLLGRALDNFTTLHNAAKPDEDGPDIDAIIPGGVFARFVDEDAAIRYALNQTCHAEEALAAARTQPVREPLTDSWILERCAQSWVFETAKQWVRMTEAAHGITKKGAPGAAKEQTP